MDLCTVGLAVAAASPRARKFALVGVVVDWVSVVVVLGSGTASAHRAESPGRSAAPAGDRGQVRPAA